MIDPRSIPERWRCWWEERAALLEYDGHMTREVAERVALAMLKTYLTQLQKRRVA